jgi:hypothetical protein
LRRATHPPTDILIPKQASFVRSYFPSDQPAQHPKHLNSRWRWRRPAIPVPASKAAKHIFPAKPAIIKQSGRWTRRWTAHLRTIISDKAKRTRNTIASTPTSSLDEPAVIQRELADLSDPTTAYEPINPQQPTFVLAAAAAAAKIVFLPATAAAAKIVFLPATAAAAKIVFLPATTAATTAILFPATAAATTAILLPATAAAATAN